MNTSVEVLACPHCDRMFHAAPAILGKAIRCRGCRKPFRIPADPESAELSPLPGDREPESLTAIECVIDGVDARECPACGRAFSMQPRFVGKKIRCRGCRVPFVVAATSPKAASIAVSERRPVSKVEKKMAAQPARAALPTSVSEPDQTVAEPPVISADVGEVLDVVPMDEPVLAAVRPGRLPRRQANTTEVLAPVIAVVMGGLMALPVTQLILWWGLGLDPLKIGRAMPQSLKGVVPVKFQR